MNPLLKQSWTTALRSGSYLQCRGVLRRSEGGGVRHCAMGVLVDLMASDWRWQTLIVTRQITDKGLVTSTGGGVPIEMQAEACISSAQAAWIASLNDWGVNFNTIADIIDRDIESEPDLAASVKREIERIGAQGDFPTPAVTWHWVNHAGFVLAEEPDTA